MEKKNYICLKCGQKYLSTTRICRKSACNGIVVVKSSDAYLLHKKSKELQLYKKALLLISKVVGSEVHACGCCVAQSTCVGSGKSNCGIVIARYFLKEAKSKV